jgi:prevent-host-death family protein
MPSQPSTPVTIPATTVHRNFSDIIRRAHSGKEHFIVERDGLPVVVILPMAEYEEFLLERERKERLRQFQEAARAIGEEIERRGITEEQLMAELEKTREALYQERYGDKRGGSTPEQG